MNKGFPVLALAFFLLTAAVSSALEMSLTVAPTEVTVQPGQAANLQVTISSNVKTGGIYLFVSGGPSNLINLGTSYISLPSKEVKVPLVFYPNYVPGTYTYKVLAQSSAYPQLAEETQVTLNVLDSDGVILSEGKIERKGNNAIVTMVLQSEEKQDAVIEFTLTDGSGVVGATYTVTEEVEGKKTVELSFPLASVVAGEYTARAVVKGRGIALTEKMSVDPVRMVVETQEDQGGGLYDEHKIKVSNDGNVVEDEYTIEANVPTGFVTFSQQPQKCEDGVCEWVLPAMNPRDGFEIVYRVEYWPLVAEGLMIAVLVSAFVVFGWNRVNNPSIVKRVEERRGTYTAVIEVRNAARKITNVTVKDFVTPLFEVDKSFEAAKPEMKHSAEGTELTWSMPELSPGEQRIIHYKMRPVINGHLRVAKASMKYTTPSGGKGRVQSGETFVAA
jgi:hypothetical protein